MVRALLPRLRAFVPRLAAPLLPVSRPRLTTTTTFRPISLRRAHSPTPTLPPNPSFSQRLKLLVKSYGWYALGVYILFSTLDFAVAFAGVNLLGADYVASVAASVKATVYDLLPSKPLEPGLDELDSAKGDAGGSGGQEGLYAMLVLAYTIHKTLFLPVRVGLTAAFTPRLVTWLRARGWAGGDGARRAASEMRARFKERNRRTDN